MKNKWLLFFIIPISAIADELLTSNVQNGCSSDLNNDTYLMATFAPNQYQCNSGYYVPANHDGCVVCPGIYNCDGGNFTFNEKVDQGNIFKTQITENASNGCKVDFLKASENNAFIMATFSPNVHVCSAGTYLPANIDECRECPANNYCGGGTYTFNETSDQGIIPCPNNQTSLSEASSITQCKTINLTWTSNGKIYTTTTCTVDGLITLPEPPIRTGYIFTGWKLTGSDD